MNRLAAFAFIAILAATSANAAPRQAASPESASGNPDKMICKRFLRTGTLANYYRTCKTKAEWERERENLRQDAGNRVATCRMTDAYAEPCK